MSSCATARVGSCCCCCCCFEAASAGASLLEVLPTGGLKLCNIPKADGAPLLCAGAGFVAVADSCVARYRTHGRWLVSCCCCGPSMGLVQLQTNNMQTLPLCPGWSIGCHLRLSRSASTWKHTLP